MLTEKEMFDFARKVCIKNQLELPSSVTYKDLSDCGNKVQGKCFPFFIPNRELKMINGKYVMNSYQPKIEINFKHIMTTTEEEIKKVILHEVSHIKYLGHSTKFENFFQELCQQNCIKHVPKSRSKLNEKLNNKISDVEELKVKTLNVQREILFDKLNVEVNKLKSDENVI